MKRNLKTICRMCCEKLLRLDNYICFCIKKYETHCTNSSSKKLVDFLYSQ
ncbi:hypothetical protein HMPREF0083_04412 [Aneurinibacillus aneurinilyticus ATCC 12856]|uniref:Uncharacterized protein n=1 Tax=Aneurinibacillus aneurinilyticus ATCC 12856 TaxID=649747 RepID=U1WXU5_ANEAE|nr:hypothetical protein HMPREF0083_04412 [Aneurinibacillus aneurinilyticus ATCC 12856]